MLTVTRVSLLLGLLSEQSLEMCVLCICMYFIYIYIYIYACIYIYIIPCLHTHLYFSLRLFLAIHIPYVWRRQWHPTPVLLPGKFHGRRSLVGCSPWDREESDTTEQLHFDFSLSCIGGGNVSPLQCSCLENPRDRGAWWAAISGVARSRT